MIAENFVVPKFVRGRVVKKVFTRRQAEKVEYELEQMLMEYRRNHGRDPLGIILGPREYLLLSWSAMMRCSYAPLCSLTRYQGIPVTPSTQKGMGFVIRNDYGESIKFL